MMKGRIWVMERSEVVEVSEGHPAADADALWLSVQEMGLPIEIDLPNHPYRISQ